MVLLKMLMEIDPLSMRGSMVMTMMMISPSRRDVSRQDSSGGALDWFRLVAVVFRAQCLVMIFSRVKDFI